MELNEKIQKPSYNLALQAESGKFRNKVEVDLVPALHISNHKLPPTTAATITFTTLFCINQMKVFTLDLVTSISMESQYYFPKSPIN